MVGALKVTRCVTSQERIEPLKKIRVTSLSQEMRAAMIEVMIAEMIAVTPKT